ncbi:LuxR C-terminal-related transcriptional regulator [Williamsia sp. MIQD14]|uniref:LuxR C-terminal-related transcriptional regulator n=1 Tax=Williamsia sp. MIQD14 TaxID=3425703 RepID=UPI003D9FC1F2
MIDHAAPGVALAGMPDAQAVLSAVVAGAQPTPVAISATAGGGKTLLLAAIADARRSVGAVVVSSVPAAPDAGTMLVIDDAHDLDDTTLARLTAIVVTGEIAVVVAAEPRDHRPLLRDLFTTIASHGRAVSLAPLTATGVVERSGRRLPSAVAAAIARMSGGNRAAIDAAISAVTTHDEVDSPARSVTDVAAAAIAAHHHRTVRRLDPATLGALTVAAAGSTLDPDTVAQTCDLDAASATAAIDAARGSGFLGDSDAFLADAVPALTAVVGAHQIATTRTALVRVLLAHNALPLERALAAATDGMVDADLAETLVAHARAARGHRAVTLWTAARAAGADRLVYVRPLAHAALESDDLDVADRIADEALGADDPTGVAAGVRIAASVAARRGTYSRAAQLFGWLGPERAGTDAAVGAVALIAAGDRAAAAEFITVAEQAPPTTDNTAAAQLAAGLMASVTDSPATAIGAVLRSMSAASGDHRIEPESAAAVAVLLMLHTGDLAGATSVLARRSTSADGSAETRGDARLLLLEAWTAMIGGDLARAAALASSVTVGCQRERLLAHALRVGTARRRGDSGALAGAWRDAQPAVAEAQADLFALLPLGELRLAAVRCGDADRIAHLTAEVDRLLAALDDPPIWASAWHWYGVQAAIISGTPDALVPHARALGAAADTHPYAAVLARAGRVWLRVLQGDDADPPLSGDEIDLAAHDLHRVGQGFDGARLAAEGALRVADTRSATVLLQTARTIGGAPSPTTSTGPETPAVPAPGATGVATLSEREAEIAEKLVLGLTYREIGAALFISAKTVEHHVARIRRRLGSGSRSELLSTLRAAGFGTTASHP